MGSGPRRRRMRALLVVAVILAGCTTPAPSTEINDDFATTIVLSEDVLLAPGTQTARFPYELHQDATSGAIRLTFAGSHAGAALEAPEACEKVTIPDNPTGGNVGVTIGCGEIPAGAGELAVRVASGTIQGEIVFAVTVRVPT